MDRSYDHMRWYRGYNRPLFASCRQRLFLSVNNLFANLVVAGVFGVGVLVGIVLVSKLIEFLFKKYEINTYYGVLGFIFASIIAIPITSFTSVAVTFDVLQIIIGVLVSMIGFVIAYKLGEK